MKHIALFVLFFAAAGQSLRLSAPMGRRAAVASAGATFVAIVAPPALAEPAPDLGAIKVLASKAKQLRATVRTSAGNRRSLPLDPTPGVNNYASTTAEVKRKQKAVLLPLQAAMTAYAASSTGLSEELQKQLALQPELMKGHLSELDYYLKKLSFDEYVSKTTKQTYPGGKVERELEEVCETIDDFFALARGQAVEKRDD